MAELLLQKLDPQNVERNYSITLQLSTGHSACSTLLQHHSYPILILSVSPCILHSVMSALCVQHSGRVADYFLIYRHAAQHIEWLKPAQCLRPQMCSRMCVCVLRGRPLYLEGYCACAVACVCVRASPVHFQDVQLSGSATGGECWSVSLLEPSLPLHITTWEILIGFTPSLLYFPPPLLCYTVGISFLGNTAL